MSSDDRLPGARGGRPPLVNSLRELPRAHRPSRDLWPAIADRLGREGNPVPTPHWWRMRIAAALALVGFMAVAAGAWLITHRAALTGASDAAGTSEMARYVKERPELMRSLNVQLAALPPASREKVLEDLQTIERSMRDVQQALGRDPGNALLRALLLDTYQDEERLLLTVQEASSWTRQADDERRKG